MDLDEVPVERALGVEWNVQEDIFNFRVIERKKAATRRGILSDVSSMYDPLGVRRAFYLTCQASFAAIVQDQDWMGRGYLPKYAGGMGTLAE